MHDDDRQDLTRRLRSVAGHVQGILKMVEDEAIRGRNVTERERVLRELLEVYETERTLR